MPHAGCLSQTRAPFLPFFPLTSTGTVDRQGLLGRRGRTQHRVLLPAAETSPEPGLFEGVTLRRPSPSLPLGGGGGGRDRDVTKSFLPGDSFSTGRDLGSCAIARVGWDVSSQRPAFRRASLRAGS